MKFSDVPVLEYRVRKKAVEFRWKAESEGFRMPLILELPKEGQKRILVSNQDWISVPMSKSDAKEMKFRDDLLLFLSKRID